MFEFFEKINHSNAILLIDDNLKKHLIRQKSSYELEKKTILEFNILTTTEFLDLMTYDISKEDILKIFTNTMMPLSIIHEKITFLKYYFTDKLEEMNTFKETLEALKINKVDRQSFLKFLEGKKIYLYNKGSLCVPILLKYDLPFEMLELEPQKDYREQIAYEFRTTEEQYIYLCNDIADLVVKGTALSSIYFVNISTADKILLKKIISFYGFSINLNETQALYGLKIVNEYVNSSSMQKIIDDVLTLNIKKVFASIDEKISNDIIEIFINILNNYAIDAPFNDEKFKEIFISDLKHVTLSAKKLVNAINLIDIEEVILLDESAIVYILNADYNTFPALVKDNSILSDTEKAIIGYPTSYEMNISNHEKYQLSLGANNIRFISYSATSAGKENPKSDLFVSIKTIKGINLTASPENFFKHNYNNSALLYKKILRTTQKSSDNRLLSTFKNDFCLSKSQNLIVREYIKKTNKALSPTQVVEYLKNPFIYYCKNVLGFSSYTQNISANIGIFFHALVEVFSLILSKNIRLEEELDFFDPLINERINKYLHTLDVEKALSQYNEDNAMFCHDFFDIMYVNFYASLIENLPNLKEKSTFTTDEKLAVKTHFYINKHKEKIITALIFLEKNYISKAKQLFLENKVSYANYHGIPDYVSLSYDEVEARNTSIILDFKTGTKKKIMINEFALLIEQLSKTFDFEADLYMLQVLQLVLYCYLYNKTEESIYLNNCGFFSYLDKKIHDFKVSYNNDENIAADDIITYDNLLILYNDLEKFLEKIFSKITNAEFSIDVRKQKDRTIKLENESLYYQALAFYKKYHNISEEDDNDNDFDDSYD